MEIEVDKRTIAEKLLAFLTTNNCRKQGWHRRDLRLNSELGYQRVVSLSIWLNKIEKAQLYADAEVLRTYHALAGGGNHNLKGRSSKFKKRVAKQDYQSLTDLLQQVWGVKSWRMFLISDE